MTTTFKMPSADKIQAIPRFFMQDTAPFETKEQITKACDTIAGHEFALLTFEETLEEKNARIEDIIRIVTSVNRSARFMKRVRMIENDPRTPSFFSLLAVAAISADRIVNSMFDFADDQDSDYAKRSNDPTPLTDADRLSLSIITVGASLSFLCDAARVLAFVNRGVSLGTRAHGSVITDRIRQFMEKQD